MDQVKLLLLEDMDTDAELIKIVLKRSGLRFDVVVIQNKIDFIAALDEQVFDAILADNSLPQFSAAEALEITLAKNICIPFILVTGSISEEYAVKMMKDGASDYILKDRLQRLPSALKSTLEKSRLERERQKYFDEIIANQALLNEAARLANFGSWEMDMLNHSQRWSDQQFKILGYYPGEVEPSIDAFLSCVHADDVVDVKESLERVLISPQRTKFNCRVITKDGSIKHVYSEMDATFRQDGKLIRINGFMQDVSAASASEAKEKKITADLLQRNKDLEQFAYIISHNLRGPVANISGLSAVLKEKELSEQDRDDFTEAIYSSIEKLDNVIIDLNSIMQAKNSINENKQKVIFSQIVDDIVSAIKKPLKEDEAVIRCNFDAVSEMLTLKSYLHSIFYNLITNSIKFRKQDFAPVIEIKSKRSKDIIELTFKDNSIGIDLDKKGNHIFGLYKRFHPEHAEGKGMGLFMVKTQVEALGGRINVCSKVNEGTEFKIEFDLHNAIS